MINLPHPDDAKSMAGRLRAALTADGVAVSHSTALELVARAHGLKDWNTFIASAAGPPSGTEGAEASDPSQRAVPILRMFDWEKAQDFYSGYLGWTVDWEHRFEDDLPLYVQISSPDGIRLHLSEHHGDGTPGSAVIIEVADAAALHAALAAEDYHYARPGLEEEPWGRTITVHDPFGNRLTFLEAPVRDRDV